ncbi:hypothetical protein HY989_00390 [Candidatus Micrarchaeota archaeon]|nr:hypothetical protein [Candidatus Micrarchaeota archaeon]
MKLLLPILFALFSLFSASLIAAEVNGRVMMVQPFQTEIHEGDLIDLGTVGPGQKLEIEIAQTSNIYDFNGAEEVWNRLKIDDSSLPLFWRSDYSLRYEANPKAFVYVSEQTSDGDYEFSLYTERDYGTAAKYPVHFKAKVKVSKDVFKLEISQKSVTGGANQPTVFLIDLTNTGSASDAFNIEAISGLPSAWKYKKQVFVPHNSRKQIQYEVVASEQGDFFLTFKGTSLSSDFIASEDTATLSAKSTLIQDMKSTANGVLLFPFLTQSVYYLMGLIANTFF